jgi:hypothetical protein
MTNSARSEIMALNSDIRSLISVITIKLNSRNYVKWKFQFITTLSGNDYFDYFDGSISAPTRYAPQTPTTASVVSGISSGSTTIALKETDEYKLWKLRL